MDLIIKGNCKLGTLVWLKQLAVLDYSTKRSLIVQMKTLPAIDCKVGGFLEMRTLVSSQRTCARDEHILQGDDYSGVIWLLVLVLFFQIGPSATRDLVLDILGDLASCNLVLQAAFYVVRRRVELTLRGLPLYTNYRFIILSSDKLIFIFFKSSF